MIYLDPKGLRLLSFPFFLFLFIWGQKKQETREIWGVEGVHKMEKGRRGDLNREKERKECGIGVVKAASFLDIIY